MCNMLAVLGAGYAATTTAYIVTVSSSNAGRLVIWLADEAKARSKVNAIP